MSPCALARTAPDGHAAASPEGPGRVQDRGGDA